MNENYEAKVWELSLAKALALASYGESVASYRYRMLAEKITTEVQRKLFVELADEEQGHHILVQDTLRKHFPDSDFVLSAHDKDLVIVGPRTLDLSDRAAFAKSMEMILASENLTGNFYAALAKTATREDLRSLFLEMAEECFTHAKLLKDSLAVE